VRFLAIDFGTKRVGLATCDEYEFGASPLTTLKRSRSLDHDLAEIARHARVQEAAGIVVGLPLHADGTHSPMAQKAIAFADALRAVTPLPVHLFDEFLTSADADEAMRLEGIPYARRREWIDQRAAVELLNAFLRARAEGTVAS
jgi:putative Holliday junction resolvase